jgi:DNA-directed RNA polymerase specialized sigma subunit
MRQRILSNALTRYRQEWAYALHCVPLPDEEGNKSLTDSVLISTPVDEELRYALLYLSPRNYWLIVQLFWEERTEAEIGVTLGISQRGVSKHKQAALTDLRGRLETSEKN